MSSLQHRVGHHNCGPVLASQSRCGNHRLESRVRENRTHGSEGGDGESRSRPLSGEVPTGPPIKTFGGDGPQTKAPQRSIVARAFL